MKRYTLPDEREKLERINRVIQKAGIILSVILLAVSLSLPVLLTIIRIRQH